MVELKVGFFNSVNEDRPYNAEDLGRPLSWMMSTGILPNPDGSANNCFQVIPDSNKRGLNIIVRIGQGFLAGKWVYSNTTSEVELTGADVGITKYNSIIIKVDNSTAVRKGYIDVVERTGSAYIPANTNTELLLAVVAYNGSITNLTADNITDYRGTIRCPWMRLRMPSSLDDTIQQQITNVDGKVDIREGLDQMIFFLNNDTQPAMTWKESDDTLWKLRFDTASGKYILEYYDGSSWTALDPFATKQDVLNSEAVEVVATSVPFGDNDGLVTENAVNVYRYGKVVEVDLITSIGAYLPNLLPLATGLPEPLRTIRFEAIPRKSTYSQPLSITIQNQNDVWTLCAQYGDASATAANPTRYYSHFTYIAK